MQREEDYFSPVTLILDAGETISLPHLPIGPQPEPICSEVTVSVHGAEGFCVSPMVEVREWRANAAPKSNGVQFMQQCFISCMLSVTRRVRSTLKVIVRFYVYSITSILQN